MTFASTVNALHLYMEHLTQLQRVVGQGDMAAKAGDLQRFYRHNLWDILSRLAPPQQQTQWQSAVTELHRHMRLLAVEVRFAQSAHQSQTRQQRLQQIEHRLEQLQGFAQGLIALADVDCGANA